MTATLNDVAKKKEVEQSAEQQAAVELVRPAKEQGLSLTGPDGLLKQLTKSVLEAALNEEMTEQLGYEKHDPAGAGTGNIRNGTRSKTVLTESTGRVGIEVPRDRAGTFEPQIVKKRQRRLNGVDEIVLSLCVKGLTTGEMSANFAEIYGASVSRETISRITDKVLEEMQDWSVRPLDERPTPRSSSTRSWSTSATGRSRTGRSTRLSASPWPDDQDHVRHLSVNTARHGRLCGGTERHETQRLQGCDDLRRHAPTPNLTDHPRWQCGGQGFESPQLHQ